MRKHYNKLVRDGIPTIIEAQGGHTHVETLAEEEYRMTLRAKLVEEAQEVVSSTTLGALVTELADVLEVLHALCGAYQIAPEVVRAVQEQRHQARGEFLSRLHLLWTER